VVLLHQGVVLHGRLDDEIAVLYKDVFVAGRGLLELAVAGTVC
jgi:hypothetical protein